VKPKFVQQSFVEVRVISPGVRASSVTGEQRTWFVPDGEDLVFRSRLPDGASVSEHLKWLHGMLQFQRKHLRQLQEDGVNMVCRIGVRGRSLLIEPEALLLMHHCHLRTEISFSP
jgi:hypothetical protein